MISKELREGLELLEKQPNWEIREIIIINITYLTAFPENRYGLLLYNYALNTGRLVNSLNDLKVVLGYSV
jgi:hypothetical protein